MSHEVETMFSRTVPWHGLGVVTGEAKSAEEAIKLAGLDWTVSKRPVQYIAEDGSVRTIPDKFATVRDTDGEPLGVVGKDFVPLQNHEAFSLLDGIVGEGDLKFDSAGSLLRGRVPWVCAKLPEAVKVAGGDDVELYAVLSHGHNGLKAIDVLITPIMVVCMNTLNFASSQAKSRFSIPHRGNVKGRVLEAQQMLGLMYDYSKELQALSEDLVQKTYTEKQVDRFLDKLYEDMTSKSAKEKSVEGTRTTLTQSQNIRDEVRGTGWGLFNATTEWWDWRRPMRSNSNAETKVRSAWVGPGRHYRERALELLAK